MTKLTPLQNFIIALVAILVIGTLEVIALLHGINGGVLSASLMAIAGIGGYTARGMKQRE